MSDSSLLNISDTLACYSLSKHCSALQIPSTLPPLRYAQSIEPLTPSPSPSFDSSSTTDNTYLADFAAQTVFHLWYGKSRYADVSSSFRRFCLDILKAASITPSGVALTLKYIHRFTTLNPYIRGRQGSEFRIFTVALMLSNKYLEDHTYTNKTWSDISGMTLEELNLMEMEFLTCINFHVHVTELEFGTWLDTLENFTFMNGERWLVHNFGVFLQDDLARQKRFEHRRSELQRQHERQRRQKAQQRMYAHSGYGHNWQQVLLQDSLHRTMGQKVLVRSPRNSTSPTLYGLNAYKVSSPSCIDLTYPQNLNYSNFSQYYSLPVNGFAM
ncbi:hypothetical protein K493DRAFT_317153 [Basidiobolus meristosporus CBS 931.73]|uniref:Cyclin-like domain-containing protein n=1 Tax=Basidiobolus meristosporus CBS 931.73 TaxID=1314790 RepID=A0A1Y1Y0Q7_9FUNG|nr:hypothetical protein K493DRAFT_317153 [Basidiobolus meristosporus CBS 931.73]|eukprot:ORX91602.1 hypothetical protein K493DRAFT_317153 [Basidiobolus meristosporus CBS 931.73]